MSFITAASRRLAVTGARTPFARPSGAVRTLLTLKEAKYTAKATASGEGRANGVVKSEGKEIHLTPPKALGGSGDGENPERLFAMGYAGCFLGAIQFKAREFGRPEMGANAIVHTAVHIGTPNEENGFGLAVDITVEGVDDEILQAAHALCPYSRATKGNIVVNIGHHGEKSAAPGTTGGYS
ncbi:organic hydroperoxide resistance protein [Coprinopsis sp. MPI-PUGE-AT-0042]|nr:organic hydroperoxide resistance protein [Coprinopsis sp. MPI-PUGE-AT-0042]KAH6906566.1 organic hydroperoxide resistance protein [Coprinopsis sp. MPI-PUGE-AT-0042]